MNSNCMSYRLAQSTDTLSVRAPALRLPIMGTERETLPWVLGCLLQVLSILRVLAEWGKFSNDDLDMLWAVTEQVRLPAGAL